MKFQRFLSLFVVLLACFVCSSHCYTFYVGGKEGWVLHPKQKYNDWAGKQRFQVNDVLTFKYEKGSDSVLLVKKDGYYKCERKHPLMEMSNGTSEFKFPHSGPFYFISGKENHCSKGQKMIAVVMADRHGTPSTHPPPIKPPGKSPYPGPAQSPEHRGPVAPSPPSSVPTGSPMAHVPTPSTHHAPQYGPTQSPVAYGPSANPPTSTSPSPSSSTPAGSSPAPSTGSGLSPPAPPQGISPSTTTSPTGSQTSTPPNGSSATETYSSVLVLAASVLFSMII
ncbi:Indole-3-acetic acid-amido synthetase GH3.17 [Hibiscus syriacus]|uniref:Indole-3-acetic acid-amido synthetase GH3.17 n=1 Tax=Hibiscus syriacus TaxID=106335 RepID=A0A6A3ACR9_HIBSY|nr:early nodulin-like protein 2 [Hibiscus syriacus]KAE8702280.1 Indole-3-acetic acid-amido synthetase GH3.17 [Hibiscus syriacus]